MDDFIEKNFIPLSSTCINSSDNDVDEILLIRRADDVAQK